MTEEIITQLIGTLGFPILMCLLMYHQQNTVLKKLTEMVSELSDTQKEIVNLIRHSK